jgi:hypothetical protein
VQQHRHRGMTSWLLLEEGVEFSNPGALKHIVLDKTILF